MTRALENIASELRKVGEENLDDKILGPTVELLRSHFGFTAQDEKPDFDIEFGGSFSLDDVTGYLISMLNINGRGFLSPQIEAYMEQESIPFFDLFEGLLFAFGNLV